MAQEHLADVIRTLVVSSFHVEEVTPLTDFAAVIDFHRTDELGGQVKYSAVISQKPISDPLLKGFLNSASKRNYHSLAIGFQVQGATCYSLDKFYDLLGGPALTHLVQIPNLTEILVELGFNRLPAGIDGKPDDLLEEYVSHCLRFILASRVNRYGQDRRFENVPDIIAFDKKLTPFQIDAKARKDGYTFTLDDITRFSGYANDFNSKYSHLLGPMYAFIVVSSEFQDSPGSLLERRKQLFERCQANLVCVTSSELGEIVSLIKENSLYRSSLNWKSVFANLVVTKHEVEALISSIKKDRIKG